MRAHTHHPSNNCRVTTRANTSRTGTHTSPRIQSLDTHTRHHMTHPSGHTSPHNNETIRESHRQHGVTIVGYEATDAEKAEIVTLIQRQTVHYARDQDRRAQMTKQTRELDRLPAWPPNSPDLNLVEIV